MCGLKWKTCQCALWDEHRLLLREHELVNRGDNGDAVARVRAEAVCDHENGFERLQEAGVCEDCGNYMNRFKFECRLCPLRVCLRCRRTGY